jgi:16S rRNA (cytosine967-C5)-methyltransferase
VVRRNPDIKWLRRPDDIAQFAAQQAVMLEALWRLLAPGGTLLYATCSIFHEENDGQVQAFLARHAQDAERCPLPAPLSDGSLLPDAEHDGFFYALLRKI